MSSDLMRRYIDILNEADVAPKAASAAQIHQSLVKTLDQLSKSLPQQTQEELEEGIWSPGGGGRPLAAILASIISLGALAGYLEFNTPAPNLRSDDDAIVAMVQDAELFPNFWNTYQGIESKIRAQGFNYASEEEDARALEKAANFDMKRNKDKIEQNYNNIVSKGLTVPVGVPPGTPGTKNVKLSQKEIAKLQQYKDDPTSTPATPHRSADISTGSYTSADAQDDIKRIKSFRFSNPSVRPPFN